MTACRECGAEFDRAPGTPRVCETCLPAFKRRLVREGTPQAVYAYPEVVLGDDAAVRRIKRTARRLALLTTKSPSVERTRKAQVAPAPEERRREVERATAALDAALQGEDTGRLRYWASVTMIDPRFNGASGQGGVWGAASREVGERAMALLRRRGEAWRAAGLGSFATVEAVREAGLSDGA